MICPTSYATECAPRTLAVLTGLEPQEAARLLWGHRALWWDHRRAPGAPGVHGTSEDALADVLLRLGYDVEYWTGAGELLGDATVYRAQLAREAHERAVEVRRLPRVVRADVCTPAKPRASIEGPTLLGWLERHPGGGWWAVCVATEASAHVMPTWGPRILTDHESELERYGDATVYRALRVFPPKGAAA